MGAATVVASAIVFALVIIIAYIMVGSSLQMIDVVTTAQSKLTESQEERMRSSVEIWNSSVDNIFALEVYLNITNSGSETLMDYEYWDLYIYDTTLGEPVRYSYQTGALSPGEWKITKIWPDIINPGLIDPEENAEITIKYQIDVPPWVMITTPTGISDSWYVL